MDRQKYNACISSGLKGKQLGKEERKLEFCIVSKLCSGKARNREEATLICSQPKEPKPVKTSKRKDGKSCEREVMGLTQCMLNYFEKKDIYQQVLNINSVGVAMTNALLECKCEKDHSK